MEIGNNEVVKFATDAAAPAAGLSDATSRVARALLVSGALTVGEIADRLLLTPTAVRKHLESLQASGHVVSSEERPFGPTPPRGRGRPARYYSLTPAGRDAFESSYDDVALAALRFLSERFGPQAVADFAAQRAAELMQRYAEVEDIDGTAGRVRELADRLSADGYAADASAGPRGLQLCQHHCPVAHVAEEFPQLCEAEREVFAQLLGVHVTRLATLAAGDGICTTLVPQSSSPQRLHPTFAASSERTTS